MLEFDESFCEKAAECGHRSFVIMAGALVGLGVKATVLSHQDVTGVGYGICTFYPEGEDPERLFLKAYKEKTERECSEKEKKSDAYVRLARASVEAWVREHRCISVPEGIPEEMLTKRAGAFVSLHKQGRLRGCIGHFGEDTPLWEIVAEMARAAAFEDPRFPPLSRNELDDTDIEISVLTPMRRIQSLDEFQLHRHGIYIRKGYRSGTFLPQVADEVNWTKEEFVGHCSQDKAGLGWDGWRDAELYVYEAIVF
jgi:AmmeMemoRadiSam system protein A